jgi:hypothetical protein
MRSVTEEVVMEDAAIVSAVRTPVGSFAGHFKDVPATELGAHAVRAALERAGLPRAVPIPEGNNAPHRSDPPLSRPAFRKSVRRARASGGGRFLTCSGRI